MYIYVFNCLKNNMWMLAMTFFVNREKSMEWNLTHPEIIIKILKIMLKQKTFKIYILKGNFKL